MCSLSLYGFVQFVGGKFEARDHMIKSNTTREFDLEEEHKVRLPGASVAHESIR